MIAATPTPVAVALSDDQPGSLGPLTVPDADTGPYFSYGVQWIAFGALAPLVALYLLAVRRRTRHHPHPTSTRTEEVVR